tara:strand:+ start:223 stop:801 length:579 start_codon:yes stop_codon:yes gene_type:complete
MVNQSVYFTSPDAFFPPEQRMSLADQLAGQGFLSPGVEGPGGQMFYGVAPEMASLMGGTPDHMYAGESITPDFLRYMAQSWGGGSMSPDQLRQAFPEYLHSYMPQLDPTTRYSYEPGEVDKEGYESQAQYKYDYAQPIAAPKFQQLPSVDIQQQMDKQTEAETERAAAEAERERRPLLRSGAGRSMFGAGRT